MSLPPKQLSSPPLKWAINLITGTAKIARTSKKFQDVMSYYVHYISNIAIYLFDTPGTSCIKSPTPTKFNDKYTVKCCQCKKHKSYEDIYKFRDNH